MNIKELNWLNNNRAAILKCFIENKEKIGFVKVYVGNNYKSLQPEFIEGVFNQKEFKSFLKMPTLDLTISDAFNVYYEVLWFSTKTKLRLKETILESTLFNSNHKN